MKTLIICLLIFSVIVVFHEWGHFYFARKAGIKTREFSVGMGPKLFSGQGKDGTAYTLRMLPLGGFVRLAGLDEEDEIEPGMAVSLVMDDQDLVECIDLRDSQDPQALPVRVNQADLKEKLCIQAVPLGQEDLVDYSVSREAMIIEPDGTRIPIAPLDTRYESATPWEKFVTNAAGPMNNFILSIIVFSLIAFILPGVPHVSQPDHVLVGQVVEGSPAYEAGIQAGDIIQVIQGQEVHQWEDMTAIVQAHPGESLDIQLEREGQLVTLPVTIGVTESEETGQTIGQLGVVAGLETHYDSSFWSRISYGFTETWSVVTGVLGVIAGMVRTGFNINNFGGPIAMAQMTNQVVDYGLVPILSFTAYISANIGIFNLLPIPALDGGKLILNIIEGIRGKPIKQSTAGIINLIGLVLILVLVLAVTWNDIQRAFF